MQEVTEVHIVNFLSRDPDRDDLINCDVLLGWLELIIRTVLEILFNKVIIN